MVTFYSSPVYGNELQEDGVAHTHTTQASRREEQTLNFTQKASHYAVFVTF